MRHTTGLPGCCSTPELGEPRRAARDRRGSRFVPATTRRSGEPLVPVETTGIAAHALPLLPIGPQLIVFAPFLRVSQNLVSLVDLFEALLGPFVARVNVRVIFAGQTAIGFLDLLLAGVPIYPQNLVIVSVFHIQLYPAGL